ncbi:MAG: hydroxyacid dehydrogenase [Omnitrophica bacterium GWA2_52_12]|nr:MAG: hydroxyacid dehydrogenase [Omnitrophica bacterium GWA2_52_12]
MQVAVFNTKPYDREFLTAANKRFGHTLVFFESHLTPETCKLAYGFEVLCVFVNDVLNRQILSALAEHGTRLVALRCAGFNNVDLAACRDLGITVARVPAYSPHGVAEHAVMLMLALNRKICRAHQRVHDGNFSLEGLLGFEMHAQTVGVLGTGQIGANLVQIMKGFGANVLCYDVIKNPLCESLGGRYVPLQEIFAQSDILTLHLPLTPETHHLINADALHTMKDGVMLINTSRGGLIDTRAVIGGLKSGKIGYLGLDVYEEEQDLFFEDLSGQVLQDDTFARLLTFPNVLITGHQAFFTSNALSNIAETTLKNIENFKHGRLDPKNEVRAERLSK